MQVFKLVLIFIFVCSNGWAKSFYVNNSQKRPKSRISMKSLISKYKKSYLEKHLRDFVYKSRPNRMVGNTGHLAARNYLVERIKDIDSASAGLLWVDTFDPDIKSAQDMYKSDFENEIVGKFKPTDPTFKKWNGFTQSMVKHLDQLKGTKGKNIVWEKKGFINPEEIIIVGAHYDTISFDKQTLRVKGNSSQPGADNNASGVAALLSLIEILSVVDTPKTIRVVFFDFQEFGFLGSKAFVKKYKEELTKKKKLFSFVNVLMIGHDSKKADKTKRFGNMKNYIRSAKQPGFENDYKVATLFSNIARKFSFGVRFETVSNGFNSGDHINFWKAGFPAMTLTQNWEDDFNQSRHHTSNDFVETLNLKTYYSSFKYLTGGVLGWAYDLR